MCTQSGGGVLKSLEPGRVGHGAAENLVRPRGIFKDHGRWPEEAD